MTQPPLMCLTLQACLNTNPSRGSKRHPKVTNHARQPKSHLDQCRTVELISITSLMRLLKLITLCSSGPTMDQGYTRLPASVSTLEVGANGRRVLRAFRLSDVTMTCHVVSGHRTLEMQYASRESSRKHDNANPSKTITCHSRTRYYLRGQLRSISAALAAWTNASRSPHCPG